jgi:hypothetical protein
LEKAGNNFTVRTSLFQLKTAIPCKFRPFYACKEKATKKRKKLRKTPKNAGKTKVFAGILLILNLPRHKKGKMLSFLRWPNPGGFPRIFYKIKLDKIPLRKCLQ